MKSIDHIKMQIMYIDVHATLTPLSAMRYVFVKFNWHAAGIDMENHSKRGFAG